ncbi:MAG TPA: hypothetical protein VM163_05315 [bacterium]|nr:hypothetical protein [bacterium]
MFDLVYFDISGKCNARCPWCQTGVLNLNKKPLKGGHIDVKTFARAIEYMLKMGIIGQSTLVDLYNWGEPFLNPQFKEIIHFMSTTNVQFGLSTNCSILITFDRPDLLVNLKRVLFSMCGFSQASYDRIHGFNFETVKRNIVTMVDNFRQCGFHQEASIPFHLYQFNLDEMRPAHEFGLKHEIGLYPYYALFNGFDMTMDYLCGSMPYKQLKKVSEELVLFYVQDLIAKMPEAYRCPQYDILTLDEHCNVLTCCFVEKYVEKFVLGSIFDLTLEEINASRMQPVCKKCISTGASYWVHNGYYKSPL